MLLDTKIQWAIDMAYKTSFANQEEFIPEEIITYSLAYLKMHGQVGDMFFEMERKRAQDLYREKQELEKQNVDD